MDAVISSIAGSGDIRVFELRTQDGAPLPPYQAGAHLDVTLANGLARQYSLCCRQPSAASYRIAVKREPQSRGGSEWLHAQARVGDLLRIGTPRNAFALAPDGQLHLLFAGGIGVTPILAMAYELLRRGQPFRLLYFVRDQASVAFAEEFAQQPLAQQTDLCIGLAPLQSAQRIGAMLDAAGSAGTHVYACGPAAFMDSVVAQAEPRFGPASVHKESFGAAPPSAGNGDTPFMLRLARSGRDIAVPAGVSALASLQAAGLDVDCSCEVGVCGTCRLAVLDGVPEHRDTVLNAQQRQVNNCFMPCVSRSRTPLLHIDL